MLASEAAPDWLPGVFWPEVKGTGRGRGREAGRVFLNSDADTATHAASPSVSRPKPTPEKPLPVTSSGTALAPSVAKKSCATSIASKDSCQDRRERLIYELGQAALKARFSYPTATVLGHSDIKTTMRYAHLEQSTVTAKARDVIERFNGFHSFND